MQIARGDTSASDVRITDANRLHLDFLDGLRALAALYVVAHHVHRDVWGEHYPTRFPAKLTNFAVFGHFSVSVFIVLSGFCLMLPVVRGDGKLRGGTPDFFRRRARRILPPYYFAILFALILNHFRVSAKDLVLHLLLVHNLFRSAYGSINGALWSIGVEWQIYFLFPLLILAWRRFGELKTLFTVIILAYALYALTLHRSLQGLTPHFVALFALGMMAATVAYSPLPRWAPLRARIPWLPATFALMALTIGACMVWGPTIEAANFASADLFVGLATLCLLIALSIAPFGRIHRFLSWTPLVWLGTFSYSLYLVHWPILLFIRYHIREPWRLGSTSAYLWQLCIGMPVCIALAYLFHLLCERPFMSNRQRASAKREETAVISSVSYPGS